MTDATQESGVPEWPVFLGSDRVDRRLKTRSNLNGQGCEEPRHDTKDGDARHQGPDSGEQRPERHGDAGSKWNQEPTPRAMGVQVCFHRSVIVMTTLLQGATRPQPARAGQCQDQRPFQMPAELADGLELGSAPGPTGYPAPYAPTSDTPRRPRRLVPPRPDFGNVRTSAKPITLSPTNPHFQPHHVGARLTVPCFKAPVVWRAIQAITPPEAIKLAETKKGRPGT